MAIGIAAPTRVLLRRVPASTSRFTVAAFAIMVAMASLLRVGGKARKRVDDMVDAFVVGAKYAIGVGAAAATVGIIVGVVTLTGVGFKISFIVTSSPAQIGAGRARSSSRPALRLEQPRRCSSRC